jgi:hypothetical protein
MSRLKVCATQINEQNFGPGTDLPCKIVIRTLSYVGGRWVRIPSWSSSCGAHTLKEQNVTPPSSNICFFEKKKGSPQLAYACKNSTTTKELLNNRCFLDYAVCLSFINRSQGQELIFIANNDVKMLSSFLSAGLKVWQLYKVTKTGQRTR